MAERFLILSIETATGCGSVALTRGETDEGRVLAEATAQPEITHSRQLLGSVEWVIHSAGVSWQDVDGIAVSLGPGSFTGLRIGMAAVKGMVLATGVPMLGVSTFDAIALSCPLIDRPLWCLLDARKQEVYAACYLPGRGGRPVQHGDPVAVRPELLVEQISEPALFAGPGVEAYREYLVSHAGNVLLPAALTSPRAARTGFLAAAMLAAGNTLDPATAVPLYVRASDAEINLQTKQVQQ